MADRRLDLQTKLEELLGSDHVYYQPPTSLKMEYDAIRYSRKAIDIKYANNSVYTDKDCYKLTVIARKPDQPVIRKLLQLPYCSYDTNYIADNLYHDVLTLYY